MVIPVLVPSLSVFRHVKKRCKREPKICTHIKKKYDNYNRKQTKARILEYLSLFIAVCWHIVFVFIVMCWHIEKR